MLRQNKRIILSSKSPRRQSLLKGLEIKFEVVVHDVEEIYPKTLPVEKVPEYLARLKAEPFLKDLDSNTVVITSDTVVLLNGKVLGKPKDEEDAKRMLKSLSGNKHQVVTGVCLTEKDKQNSFSSVTDVCFDKISETEINYYFQHFKPLDKAGSYGIQEWIGYAKIQKIEGCYYNVMGLPLRDLYLKMIDLGIVS